MWTPAEVGAWDGRVSPSPWDSGPPGRKTDPILSDRKPEEWVSGVSGSRPQPRVGRRGLGR